jgi:sugar-specific transcriptional regulator TrmB
MQLLANELQNLGFTDKEARVYLTGLALGPAAVQIIARESGVNRATTYVIIEQLSKRGLFSAQKRGKKRYFNAEHPDRLVEWFETEMRNLTERYERLREMLGELTTLVPAEATAVRSDEAVGAASVAEAA